MAGPPNARRTHQGTGAFPSVGGRMNSAQFRAEGELDDQSVVRPESMRSYKGLSESGDACDVAAAI